MIHIYTDWSSIGNPWPWWWGVLVVKNKSLSIEDAIEVSWWEQWTTNNRMELTAVIEGLKWIVKNEYLDKEITIHMDSMYVHDGILKYLSWWIARWWKLANKKPVLNKDLWLEIHTYLGQCSHITRKRVKAHATSIYNNRIDEIARKQALKIQKSLPPWYTPPSKIVECNGQHSLFG